MITLEQFIRHFVTAAIGRGYKIESHAWTGQTQIDFGNKKLHAGHLADLYPAILTPGANISALIDRVAPGRPCAHRPTKEIIAQLRAEGRFA